MSLRTREWEHRFKGSFTTPADIERLVKEVKPERVVIEVCNIAGWVCDLLRRLGVEVQVAYTSDDAWRWRKVKKKNDRCDALKIAAVISGESDPRSPYSGY